MGLNPIDLFNTIGQVDDTANAVGLRPELLHAVVQQESGYNPQVRSPKGAIGLTQSMPSTAAQPGYGVAKWNPQDPQDNLKGGATYLKALVDHFGGDEQKALAAYNSGPGAVEKAGGVPDIPETKQYVANIQAKAPARNPIDLFNSLNEAPPPTVNPPETPEHAVMRLAQERQAAEPSLGDSVGKFAAGAWENLNPINMAKGIGQAVVHPIDTGKALIQGQVDQFKKAQQDYNQGHYSEMVGHGAASLLPILGPAAANAGETIAKGDVAKGLGQGTGLIASVVAPRVISEGITGTGAKLSKGAERIINSNVKPNPSLVARNPNINIPRVILDEGFAPGEKGAAAARGLTKDLSNQVTDLNAADAATGAKYSLQPLEDALLEKRAHYLQSPAGAGDVAAIDSALQELRNHPLYSKEKMGTVMVEKKIPASTVLDASGNPMSPARTEMVPEQQVIGRELVPQDASTLNTMKKGIYEENPKAYGERKGAAVEGDKAQGRALKGIMDANVEGVQPLNQRQSGVIVARKALEKMAGREANKYPLGLMDLMALSGGALVGGPAGAGLMGMLDAGVRGGALFLKHPTTAFPIARGLDSLGSAVRGVAPTTQAGLQMGVAGQQIENETPLQRAIRNLKQ